MALTPGSESKFSITLRVAGTPVRILEGSTVTAQIYASDGVTAVSPPVPAVSASIGADWSNGLVVIEFTGQQTALISPPSVIIAVTVENAGQSRSWRASVPVVDPVAAAVDERSALFPSKIEAVAKLRRDRLMLLAGSIMPDASFSDDFLWEKLLVAESTLSNMLRVKFEPTRFFPRQPTAEQIAALGSMPWEIDPAYDYIPDGYSGDKWGFIQTRQRPIQSIVGIRFSYPDPKNPIYEIPPDWIRFDGRYGQVQILPTGTSYSTMLGAMFMGSLSGGRQLPFTVDLDYVAGIADIRKTYPEIIDLAQRMAVTSIVDDSFFPASGSISADGLSQSTSVDSSKYHDAIDRSINGANGNGGLMARIHGIRVTVI